MNKFKNHLRFGSVEIKHLDKNISTSINSIDFEKYMENIRSLPFKYIKIPPGYEHRADLISNVFYKTPTLDWLVCWYNNIKDPFQQLNVGDILKLPEIR